MNTRTKGEIRPFLPVETALRIDSKLQKLADDAGELLQQIHWARHDFTCPDELGWLLTHLRKSADRLERSTAFSRAAFNTASAAADRGGEA